jgi:SAM-dependent methyltransferase
MNDRELYSAKKDDFEKVFEKGDPWNLQSGIEQLRYKFTIDKIKKELNPKSNEILELGCAEGNFSEYLSKDGFYVESVDISERAIENAKAKNIKNVKFLCCDMMDYIAKNYLQKYNAVLLLECLYYLSIEKRRELIKALFDKLADDTKVFLSYTVRLDNLCPSKEEMIKMFINCGYKFVQNKNPVVISLKGISGRILVSLKYYWIKKLFINFHNLLLPYRINQILLVFKK